MKKKILLALAISILLVCLFAIGVSADAIKRFETDEFQTGDNITYLDGINEDMYLSNDSKNNSFYELLDPNFTARAVLQNSDGTYTTYPAWYFITYTHYWNGAEFAYTMERINAFSEVTGETYSTGSIIRYEYPEYKANHGFLMKYSVSFGFANAKYVRVPSHAISMNFRNCVKLVEIELAPGANITSVSDKAFVDCHSIEVIRIPNSATSMGSEIVAFWSTSASTAALKEIYLGANMTTLGTKNPLNTANINGLKIYVPETLDGTTYNYGWFPKTAVIIYTGDKEGAEAFGFHSEEAGGSIMSWDEYVANDMQANPRTIVYGYSQCDAFYNGAHEFEAINGCQGQCTVCGQIGIIENPEHTEELKLGFGVDNDADGIDDEIVEAVDFYANMYVLHVCVNCASETADTENYAPVFVKMGYSAEEEDTTSISFFTSVNSASLLKYEEIAGTKLQYGLVVSAVATASPIKSVVDGAIELNASTVKVSMTNTVYAKFSVRISNLPANRALNCCGYVVENDKVTYLGHNGASAEAETIDHAGVIELTK